MTDQESLCPINYPLFYFLQANEVKKTQGKWKMRDIFRSYHKGRPIVTKCWDFTLIFALELQGQFGRLL